MEKWGEVGCTVSTTPNTHHFPLQGDAYLFKKTVRQSTSLWLRGERMLAKISSVIAFFSADCVDALIKVNGAIENAVDDSITIVILWLFEYYGSLKEENAPTNYANTENLIESCAKLRHQRTLPPIPHMGDPPPASYSEYPNTSPSISMALQAASSPPWVCDPQPPSYQHYPHGSLSNPKASQLRFSSPPGCATLVSIINVVPQVSLSLLRQRSASQVTP